MAEDPENHLAAKFARPGTRSPYGFELQRSWEPFRASDLQFAWLYHTQSMLSFCALILSILNT